MFHEQQTLEASLRSLAAQTSDPGDGDLYASYCRPKLSETLRAIGLDLRYHRGAGNNLYAMDQNGKEIAYLDFLGGYGALILGHNHPALVAVHADLHASGAPFLAQASVRMGAARLAAALSDRIKRSTGADYVATFANSGAEAVEAALKHAEFACGARKAGVVDRAASKLLRVKNRLRGGTYAVHAADGTVTMLTAEAFAAFATDLLARMETALAPSPRRMALEKAFHGKTGQALSMTHNEDYLKHWEFLQAKTHFIKADADAADFDACLAAGVLAHPDFEIVPDGIVLTSGTFANISAFFLEAIQGEGGVRPVPDAFLQAARVWTQRHGVHLIVDEIQSGMGRTGNFLASEPAGIRADGYLLSKGLGGGLVKIAAFLCDRKAYEREFGMLHTSTFAEDEIASRVSLAVLDEALRPERLAFARETGEYLRNGLTAIANRYPGVIQEVRGRGLMIGVQLAPQTAKGSRIIENVSDQGSLTIICAAFLLHNHRIRIAPTLSASSTLRVQPSMITTKEECDRFLMAFSHLCQVIYFQNSHELMCYMVGKRALRGDQVKDFRKREPRGEDQGVDAAFIGHLIETEHMYEVDPSCRGFSAAELDTVMERVFPVAGSLPYPTQIITSKTGATLRFRFYGFFINSKIIERYMRDRDLKAKLVEKVQEFTDAAEEAGAVAIGYGGYTSIFTGNGKAIRTRSVYATTGNSLTTGMGFAALLRAASEQGISPDTALFASVGCLGNIARAYTRMMAAKVGRMLLVGKPGHEAELQLLKFRIYCDAAASALKDGAAATGIARELSRAPGLESWWASASAEDLPKASAAPLLGELAAMLGGRDPIATTIDVASIREADIIVSASNSAAPIITKDMIGAKQYVICDIAVPPDVHPDVAALPNVRVVQGGIVRMPDMPGFGVAGIPLKPGLAYACMCETFLTAFERHGYPFSYGEVDIGQVAEIMALADKHGFTLGAFKEQKSF
jgi:acetylornithine/succinyldiaminopimelate/putrescine aminotransferase/predicted amino acid dehydrogenase